MTAALSLGAGRRAPLGREELRRQLLALVLAFVLEYLDDTLRSAEDVRRHLDLPTIAGIPSGGAAARRRPGARSGQSGAG